MYFLAFLSVFFFFFIFFLFIWHSFLEPYDNESFANQQEVKNQSQSNWKTLTQQKKDETFYFLIEWNFFLFLSASHLSLKCCWFDKKIQIQYFFTCIYHIFFFLIFSYSSHFYRAHNNNKIIIIMLEVRKTPNGKFSITKSKVDV